MILYLASSNPSKLREFRKAASGRGIAVEPVPGLDRLAACVEDGATFKENARKKALYYSRYTDGLVFADDSGIAVDALDGAPGVHSARFVALDLARRQIADDAPNADDRANNARLIAELEGIPAHRRTAHYLCVVALARCGEVLAITEGRADGLILEEPRGPGGFGYDPYFYYPPLGKTFAELSAEQKYEVSHRGAAFRSLLDWLERHA